MLTAGYEYASRLTDFQTGGFPPLSRRRPQLSFRGKIDGKSSFTRGVFIAINGVAADAAKAITFGKQPTFFIMDGNDISMLLAGRVGLKDFLRFRRRLLAEEGAIVVPFDRMGQSRCG
jgi:hypothetical protein